MRCKCSGCGAAFAGLAAHEKHRSGAFSHTGRTSSRRCLSTPAEMAAAGLTRITAPASRRHPTGSVLWTLAERETTPAQVTAPGRGAATASLATYSGYSVPIRGLWDDVSETRPETGVRRIPKG